MADVVFELDPGKSFDQQDVRGHNRWHPEIPPVATLRPGQTCRIDCRVWFDEHIKNDDSAADVLTAPFHTGHPLSGPFAIAGAKPGDLLVVDILDVAPAAQGELGPLGGHGWGYTGIFARTNGGGFLSRRERPARYEARADRQPCIRGRALISVSVSIALLCADQGPPPLPGADDACRDG